LRISDRESTQSGIHTYIQTPFVISNIHTSIHTITLRQMGTPEDMCLQHTAAHCSTLQHTAAHCSTLQHTAAHCSTRQHTAAPRSTLQHTATHGTTLQHTATHCNTLQHTATHCNTLGTQKITTHPPRLSPRCYLARNCNTW